MNVNVTDLKSYRRALHRIASSNKTGWRLTFKVDPLKLSEKAGTHFASFFFLYLRNLDELKLTKLPASRNVRYEIVRALRSQGFEIQQDYLFVKPRGAVRSTHTPFDVQEFKEEDKPFLYGLAYGSVHDLTDTLLADPRLSDVGTVVELMAGSAELSYYGAFRRPDVKFICVDIDKTAASSVVRHYNEVRKGAPTMRGLTYMIGDVLKPATHARVRKSIRACDDKTLAYIGKQSICYFSPQQIVTLFKQVKEYADVLVLESLAYDAEIYSGPEDQTPDWWPKDYKLVTRTVDGLSPQFPLTNHLTGRTHFVLYKERYENKKLVSWNILAEYPWTLYSTREQIHFLNLAGIDNSRIHYSVGTAPKLYSLDEDQTKLLKHLYNNSVISLFVF